MAMGCVSRCYRFALAAACLLGAAAAQGGSIDLTLTNGDDGGQPFNTTAFLIANTSAPGVDLVQFSMTVGDTQYNFDELYLSRELFVGGGDESATLAIGDRFQGGAVTDLFEYDFLNFGQADTFRGQWDIDHDNGATDVDARTVLFNNGPAANAVATFTFSDASVATYEFPDLPILESYTLSIPEPGALALIGLGAPAIARRRDAIPPVR